MPDAIIADTSCFIILTNINEFQLLHNIYGKVFTTPEVAKEYGEPLPGWIEIAVVTNHDRQQLLELQIDKGEASAIALALEMPNSTIILDDYKARKIAMQLGISITGTIGVVVKAKTKGIIVSIKPILNKMKQRNFRISPDVEMQALKEAGELFL